MSMKKGRPPIKVKRPRQPAVRHKAGPLALLNFVVNKTASFFLYSFRQFSTWKRNWIKDDKRSNPLKIKAFSVCRYYTVTALLCQPIAERGRADEADSRVAGSQWYFHHSQHLRTSGFAIQESERPDDGKHTDTARGTAHKEVVTWTAVAPEKSGAAFFAVNLYPSCWKNLV
mgnify:CR=1 FL=1